MACLRSAILVVLALAALPQEYLVSAKLRCDQTDIDFPKNWITMGDTCVDKLKAQVNREVYASIQYLALGAHFSRDAINRPGFAKFFFESASEEREHAKQLIEYLLTRGELTIFQNNLISLNETKPKELTWTSGSVALRSALNLEHSVTEHIKSVMEKCEKSERADFKNHYPNDYHLVDYLTEFLGEQYKSMRDIAGKISTLKKMHLNERLGEFLFDKTLL